MEAKIKAVVEFLEKECEGYLDADDFEWSESEKRVSVWFRATESEIHIEQEEFLYAIEEFKSLKSSDDGTFVRTIKRTSRIIQPVSRRANTIGSLETKLAMKLEGGASISFRPLGLWVAIAAWRAGAYHDELLPPETYGSVELFYPKGVAKMSERDEEEIIDAYLFELASSEKIVFQKSEFFDGTNWDFDEDEAEYAPKFRPLEPFNEGMRLFMAAVPVEDPELRLLSLFKVLEFFAPIVLSLDSVEALRKKLDSPMALSPDANYLKSTLDLVRSLDERRNDIQMMRLLFETCFDFVELSTMLPTPRFKELKYADKKADIDAQSRTAAEALVATRNQVAHAKSDYRPTGLEIPLAEMPDFNLFLEAATIRTIRWYNRLPVHLKLKF